MALSVGDEIRRVSQATVRQFVLDGSYPSGGYDVSDLIFVLPGGVPGYQVVHDVVGKRLRVYQSTGNAGKFGECGEGTDLSDVTFYALTNA